MVVDPRPITRPALARICQNDPEAIRLLERLFIVAGQLTPEQLAQLAADITALETQVAAIQSDVAALETAVAGLQAIVAGLQVTVAGLADSVTALQIDLAALEVEVADKADAAASLPAGGTAGQFLRKQSGTDYDAAWFSIVAADVSGLGTMALQSAGAVAITGGALDNVALTNSLFTGGAINGATLDASILTGAAVMTGSISGGTVNATINATTLTSSGASYLFQPAPTSKSAAATLTIVELLTGIIQYTGAAANLTMPTGTNIDAGVLAGLATNRAFEFSVINTGTGAATMVVNTGVTAIGSLVVANGTSARFSVRKTAANTFVMYRL